VATIGGVIANNADGMRCTLARNAYHTVSSLTLVLASGTVIDTAAPDAEATFAAVEPELANGLLQLRAELKADAEKAGLDQTQAQAYLSANRTCEMGLRQATGYPYESFVFLLEELTR